MNRIEKALTRVAADLASLQVGWALIGGLMARSVDALGRHWS